MLTLEEAIEYAERMHKESRNALQYALKRGETKFAEQCGKDTEKYGQLAAYLRELQERRKAPEYEPVTAEDLAKTMSENTLNSFIAWYRTALNLMEKYGFVICKKTM